MDSFVEGLFGYTNGVTVDEVSTNDTLLFVSKLQHYSE